MSQEQDPVPITEIRRLAEQGDADSQYSLARMHITGEGVREDDAEAMKWFRLAAAEGNARAQYSLGGMYDDGEVV